MTAEPNTPAGEPARDILAAEAFAMPAPDPALHHGPIRLPEDPTGIAEPHDVLAAEEFPMPAARPLEGGWLVQRAPTSGRSVAVAGLGALIALWTLVRVLRRR
jgi:hypothetical protein